MQLPWFFEAWGADIFAWLEAQHDFDTIGSTPRYTIGTKHSVAPRHVGRKVNRGIGGAHRRAEEPGDACRFAVPTTLLRSRRHNPITVCLYDDRIRIEDHDLLAIGYRVNTTLIRRAPEWPNVITVLDATSGG
jgi:hypothetical protein